MHKAGLVKKPHMSCLHAAHTSKQICELRQGTLHTSITEAAKAVPILHSSLQPEASAVAVLLKSGVVFMCFGCKAVYDIYSIATCHVA